MLFACNPVKQVLRDPKKFDQVKEAVIRSGACVTETTTVETVRDSIVYKEVEKKVPCDDFSAKIGDDSLSVKGGVLSISGKQKVKVITKTVRDRSLEKLLEGDIEKLTKLNASKDSEIQNLKAENKKTREELGRLKIKYKLHLGLLAIGALVVIFRRPLLKLASAI